MIDKAVIVLPQPDSPTMPERLAGLDLEGDSVDGMHDTLAQPDLGAQVADIK